MENKKYYTYIVMLISKEEYGAETIYNLARLGLLDKTMFGYMARHLQTRSATVVYYLMLFGVNVASTKS